MQADGPRDGDAEGRCRGQRLRAALPPRAARAARPAVAAEARWALRDCALTHAARCPLRLIPLPAPPAAQAHLNGKKYSKAKTRAKANEYDFAQHEPHIVQNKRDPRKLFCHRTKLHLNKVPEEVQLHVNGRRFRARMQEWEEKQKRRAIKLARTQAKAEGRAARAAAAALGSDEEEDPVLAKFAHLAQDSESEDLSSDDDEVPYADSDAEGGAEMDEARTAKQHYNTGRLAAQAQAQQQEQSMVEDDEARTAKQHYNKGRLAAQAQAKKQAQPMIKDDEVSDFEVVAGEDSEGSDSQGAGAGKSGMAHNRMEEDGSESEPDATAAKQLSIARHAARHERDAAASKGEENRKAAVRKGKEKQKEKPLRGSCMCLCL
jgi:hypothetical protein